MYMPAFDIVSGGWLYLQDWNGHLKFTWSTSSTSLSEGRIYDLAISIGLEVEVNEGHGWYYVTVTNNYKLIGKWLNELVSYGIIRSYNASPSTYLQDWFIFRYLGE